MSMLGLMLGLPDEEPQGPAAPELLTATRLHGLEGPQPFPRSAPDSDADGVVDCGELLKCVPGAEDVERSYSETADQAFSGPHVENYGFYGRGAPLPDMSFGPARNGYRGMADEPLPTRPPTPDSDGDYDDDAAYGS